MTLIFLAVFLAHSAAAAVGQHNLGRIQNSVYVIDRRGAALPVPNLQYGLNKYGHALVRPQVLVPGFDMAGLSTAIDALNPGYTQTEIGIGYPAGELQWSYGTDTVDQPPFTPGHDRLACFFKKIQPLVDAGFRNFATEGMELPSVVLLRHTNNSLSRAHTPHTDNSHVTMTMSTSESGVVLSFIDGNGRI